MSEKLLFWIILGIVVAAITNIAASFRHNDSRLSRREAIGWAAFITMFIISFLMIPFFFTGWVTTYEIREEGRIKKSRYTLWDQDGFLSKRWSLPNKIRNSARDTMVLSWIGYGEETTRKDTLAPGASIRYDGYIAGVSPWDDLPPDAKSSHKPAIVIAVSPLGIPTKDVLDSIQVQERPWIEDHYYVPPDYN